MRARPRLLLLVMLAACGKVSTLADTQMAPADVIVTISHSGDGGGAVTSAPAGIDCGARCTMTVPAGTQLTLTAVPDAHSTFGGWNGGGCTGAGPCTLTVTTDTSIDASFTKLRFALTVAPTGNGTGHVTSSPAGLDCGSTCTAMFDAGATVTLTATAGAATTFLGWTGGGCSGTGSCTVTLANDTLVQASFALDDTLVVTRGGAGGGSVTSADGHITCGASCSYQYPPGAKVTLTAAADAHSTFAGWSGACGGTAATCAVTISGPTPVTATFTPKDYTLTVAKSGNGAGTITSADGGIDCGAACSKAYPYGTAVTLTAAPQPGSTFAGWSGGGCSGTGTCQVTIGAATTVTAMFTLQPITLTVATTGTGGGAVASSPAGISCGATCSASFVYGAKVTLTATPSDGSDFVGWSGGGCSGTGACVVTLTAATSVTATFSLGTPSVFVQKSGTGGGTVTSSDGQIACGATCYATYAYGATVTLTASAAQGSTFAGWAGPCSGTGACVVTVDQSVYVTATFTANPVTLGVSKQGSGSGTITSSPAGIDCGATCAGTFAYGTTVTLTATPALGSTVTGWSGAPGCTSGSTCTVTLTAAASVAVTFTQQQVTLAVTVSSSVNGSGTVTSNVGGISCPGTCSATLPSGTPVTLTAAPSNGSAFQGWTGPCSGTGTCTLTLTATTQVGAAFTCPSVTFTYTGAAQTYTVPACASRVHVEAWGAQGATGQGSVGGASGLGGLGGYAKGDLAVQAGQQLTIMVGGQSLWNGGGAGVDDGTPGNGGDASDVRLNGTALGNRIVVAGGGGGGIHSAEGNYAGGAGGGGTCGASYCGGGGGQGNGGAGGPGSTAPGTGVIAIDAGGAGGGGTDGGGQPSCATRYNANGICGARGIYAAGGAGDATSKANAPTCYSYYGGTAGGGGGFYGGGGSSIGNCGGGGGGGGSSWVSTNLSAPVLKPGVQAGTGQVTITPF